MKSIFRILLWPILWWGFTAAMYCADVQLAPPLPLTLDLSHVSEAAIEGTVIHLQQLNHESEARADALQHNLDAEHAAHLAAQNEAARLQAVLDAANARAAKAEADAAEQRKWKWRLFSAWAATVALIAAFFIARQYVPFLKLL